MRAVLQQGTPPRHSRERSWHNHEHAQHTELGNRWCRHARSRVLPRVSVRRPHAIGTGATAGYQVDGHARGD
eukprot:4245106-Alexandrium_andersonii.AAC.1